MLLKNKHYDSTIFLQDYSHGSSNAYMLHAKKFVKYMLLIPIPVLISRQQLSNLFSLFSHFLLILLFFGLH